MSPQTQGRPRGRRAAGYAWRVHVAVLLAAVVAISWAAPLIRLAEAPVLVIAALRVALAAAPMAAAASWRSRDEVRMLVLSATARRDAAFVALAGVALACHFWAWVAAIDRTSIITSVALVALQPLIAALGAWLFLRERPPAATLAGMAIAFGGALLLVADDLGERGTLAGDLLALLAAVLVSGYLVLGRRLRRRLSNLVYGASVYSVAAMILLVAIAASGTPLTGHPVDAYLLIAALALGPQLVGHNALNWALRALPAATVAVATLGEPVGAALIAAVLLDELPNASEVAGSLVVLLGVGVALGHRLSPAARPSR